MVSPTEIWFNRRQRKPHLHIDHGGVSTWRHCTRHCGQQPCAPSITMMIMMSNNSPLSTGLFFWAYRFDSVNGSELWVFFWLDRSAHFGQSQLDPDPAVCQGRLHPLKKNTACVGRDRRHCTSSRATRNCDASQSTVVWSVVRWRLDWKPVAIDADVLSWAPSKTRHPEFAEAARVMELRSYRTLLYVWKERFIAWRRVVESQRNEPRKAWQLAIDKLIGRGDVQAKSSLTADDLPRFFANLECGLRMLVYLMLLHRVSVQCAWYVLYEDRYHPLRGRCSLPVLFTLDWTIATWFSRVCRLVTSDDCNQLWIRLFDKLLVPGNMITWRFCYVITTDCRIPNVMEYKVCTLVYRCIQGNAPRYLADHVALTSSIGRRRGLRSADTLTLEVPRTQLSFGDRAFSVAGPRTSNSLPINVRSPS